ncbi:MAG TPA: radical SAM protein [Acidobacteriaceae bacterium]|nr:radical SAM protein [Acidobacteriaceae bacterium]
MAEYHVENFGCRASRSDGEAIAAGLRSRGLTQASGLGSAHVVILNTCSVTAEADRTARAFVRKVRRENPKARIVVTGCYAQRAPEEVAALEGVDAVIGNSHKGTARPATRAFRAEAGAHGEIEGHSLWEWIGVSSAASSGLIPVEALTRPGPLVLVDETFAHAELARLPFAADAQQTRPNLKVQDGCANRCSFCVIPATRGPSRSVLLPECLDDVRRFADGGGQELVLSGINLGRWGRDLKPARTLVELVEAILRETALPRLRLSSIEPMDWGADLLALFAEFATGARPRLAPHAHLPLQSGSDGVLRRMYRRYRPWHYAERVAAVRAMLPDAAIGADVMVGFPGESEAEFRESYAFIAAQPLTYLHLFPFSARPGTPGWELHRKYAVAAGAVVERMAALRALADEKGRAFRRGLVGRKVSVVTLEGGDGERTPALAANFLKVDVAGAWSANQMVDVIVTPDRDGAKMAGQSVGIR